MLAKTVSGHFSSVKIIAAAVVGRFCLQSEDGSWLSGDDVVVCMDCVISLIAYCSSCPPPCDFIYCLFDCSRSRTSTVACIRALFVASAVRYFWLLSLHLFYLGAGRIVYEGSGAWRSEQWSATRGARSDNVTAWVGPTWSAGGDCMEYTADTDAVCGCCWHGGIAGCFASPRRRLSNFIRSLAGRSPRALRRSAPAPLYLES